MMRLLGGLVLASVLFSVEQWIRAGGLLMLVGLLLACGMGFPLPEDVPLTITGFLIATGHMHLWAGCLAAWLGIIGGDMILYHLGRRYGLNITRVPFVGKHVTEARIRQAEVLFERYGIWVVAFGRMFAGIRSAMVIAAGAIKYNRVKFLIADGLAAVVSGGLFVAIGHWVGTNLGSIEQLERFRAEKIRGLEHWLLVILGLLVLAVVAYIWFRRKTHERPSEAILEKAAERVLHKGEHKHPHQ